MLKLPTDEKVFQCVQKVQGLSAAEIDSKISSRIGEPMMGAFTMIATKLQGDNPDRKTVADRVRLMVYGYLLCTEAFDEVFAAADLAAKK
jgi:hypothetical protein